MHSAPKPRSASHAHPRRRPRRAALIGTLLALGLLGTVIVFFNGGRTDAASTSAAGAVPTGPATSPASPASPLSPASPASPASPDSVSPRPSGTGAAPGTSSPAPSRKPTPPGAGPTAGNGKFRTARAAGTSVGRGTVRRYKVQVEDGSGVPATAAADEIAGILADPRGWTADGHDAFQLVSGGSYDFEIKIATPGTVDAICGAAGLHTHGEVNCDVGDQVVVNLKRWNTGSPEFPGPLHEYRALIINHEVGHRIGHGHEGCPGPGRPAPAMMQQIDGLHGCTPNAWPYDRQGRYLSGPPVP
ncbi:DUF3152 domain-containing protein [Streptomyces sp. NBC_01476]|uniref:DUF3152 domain-containing protein n=1 Tax=Streptomyces sp. NBC_01476 TaxID=2903881 RepID=UPI002E30C7AF|nr:DUF3152 domain-containing protein [Streptomyces sp. NBC_01476]